MSASFYEIRLCQNPDCRLRYPLIENHPFGERCPACLGATHAVLKRALQPSQFRKASQPTNHLTALLDNVRSAWNVGAILRTADGLGLEKLYLCGITPTPENKAVRKTSLGAEERVAWEYFSNALEAAKRLKGEGHRLIALEQAEGAISLSETQSAAQETRLVLVVGNEITGVDPELLSLCDQVIHIPMRGNVNSLNVEVAFGIAGYALSQPLRRF